MFRACLLVVAIVSACQPTAAAGEAAAGDAGRRVGTVLGKAITAADIELTGPIDVAARFDSRDKEQWELMGRIQKAFAKPLVARFLEEHKVEATKEEIEVYKKARRASRAQRLADDKARREEVGAELAAADLADKKRTELEEERGRLEIRLARDAERVEREPSELMGRILIVSWKLQRELQRKYGGRVIFQQFGPEALDATRKLFEEAEGRGELTFDDPGVRHLFYYYYVHTKHTEVDGKVLEQDRFSGETG